MTYSSRTQCYLFDGMALLFRSFYAMSRTGLTSPQGTPIGAVYGFLRILLKILEKKELSHLAVCWDLPEPTFRHHMYPAYKGTRSSPPEDLVIQIPIIQSLLVELGVPAYSLKGYEADDIIGTFAKRFSDQVDVYIVSLDKDFLQLVNPQTFLYSLKQGDEYEKWDAQHVYDFYGVKPEQIIDYLAIRGDSVDNVPGAKGIGEKGAQKLLQEFGTLESIFHRVDEIKNTKTKNSILESKENILLSKELVTIETNVPLNADLNDIRFTMEQLRNPTTQSALENLKMGSLLRLVFPNGKAIIPKKEITSPKEPPQDTANPSPSSSEPKSEIAQESLIPEAKSGWGERNYFCATQLEDVEIVVQKILNCKSYFAFDTETTGLDILLCQPIGFCFCFEAGIAYYVPISGPHLAHVAYDPKAALEKIHAALMQTKATLVAHHFKFDWHMCSQLGWDWAHKPYACTMVAGWMVNTESPGGYGLDAQSLNHLGLKKIPTSQLIGKETGFHSMTQVPLGQISEYGCEDADATFRLWDLLHSLLKKQNLEELFFNMEMPILEILLRCERAGVHVDSLALADLCEECTTTIASVEKSIFQLAGETFNVASPKQLGAILFEKLKIHEAMGFKGKLAKTTLGFKTSAGVLEEFEEHPLVKNVLEYRELSKLLNTYIQVLPQLIHPSTGRLHTHFNQIGTATGRLSSNDPNLQNIPVRTPLGRRIRGAFSAPSEAFSMVSADYSQIELRVLAHLSGDEVLSQSFRNGGDIHRDTAAKILSKDPKDVTSEERSRAKAINFGIIYGMGPQRLAKEQNITLAQAKKFIETYFNQFPKVRGFLDSQKSLAHELGYVCTAFGRRRHLSFLQGAKGMELRAAENMAINSPIQGTAADIVKRGMIATHNAILKAGLRSQVLLQVHDELVLESPVEELKVLMPLIKETLENAVEFSVPLTVEVHAGKSWLEAK